MARNKKVAQHKLSPMQRRAREAGDEVPVSRDLLPYSSPIPSIDISDDDIGALNFEYSIFDKEKDFVIGGPLGASMEKPAKEGKLPGRWFADWHDALAWAKKTYGKRLKGRKPSEPGDTYRWAVIVRKEIYANG